MFALQDTKIWFAYLYKASFTIITKHAKVDNRNIYELPFLFAADMQLIQRLKEGKKRKKLVDISLKNNALVSHPNWELGFSAWLDLPSLPFLWSDKERSNSAKHCPDFFFNRKYCLYLVTQFFGKDGRKTCSQWEDWIIVSQNLLSLTFIEYHSQFMDERELLSDICPWNLGPWAFTLGGKICNATCLILRKS